MSAVQVPADFPSSLPQGAVSGAQPKLLATEVGEGYKVPAIDEDATRQRYLMCEDLVDQIIAYRARKASENPDWSEEALDTKIETTVQQKAFGWGLSTAELEWLLMRLRQQTRASKE